MTYQSEIKYKIETVDDGDWSHEVSVKVLKDALRTKSIIIKQGSESVVFKGEQVADLVEIVKLLKL